MRFFIFNLLTFFAILNWSGTAVAQSPTFTFDCICGYVTGDTCDVCDDETLQSRLFKGLVVYRNGTMYRLIDAPYIVLFRDSTAVIQELTYPNPEKITIGIEGTNFSTLDEFQDSLMCPCNLDRPYIAGPGINIYNDTIASIPQFIDTFDIVSGAQDTLRISLSRDSVPYLFVILPGGGGAQSWTIDADAGDTELISNQTVLFAGAGINTTNYDAGTNTLTITGTEVDGSTTNEAWTIDGDAGDTELITTQTVLFEGTGIVNTTYTSATNTLTIDAVEVDGSTTNELQTFSNTSTSTTHTLTLSNSGGSLQYVEGAGIGLATTGTTLDGILTITNTGDLSATNEAWTIDADAGATEVISTQTVLFAGGGINTTNYDAGTNTLTITGTEVDGSTTNEAWTIDGDAGATEVISNQTVLFAGGGINSTNYDAGTNTLTITGTESDGDPNNEIQVLSGLGSAPNYSINLSTGGGSIGIVQGTNMTITRSGNDFTFNAAGATGLTAADNGLNVVGTTVKLGGPLTQAGTSIEIGNSEVFRWYGEGKWSVSSWTGFGIDPRNSKAGISGLEGNPTTNTSPTIDAILELNPNNSAGTIQSNSLAFGGYATDSEGFWIQSRSSSNPSFEYPMSLQPRGGQMSVGRLGGLDALVTFAGIGVAGTGIGGSILHLENSEGNGEARLSFGGGTDFLDAAISWFDATDALRQNNYSTTNGTSSHRWSFGTNPASGDVMMLVKSGATPGMRLGIGETVTTNVHSTLQNRQGSIAPGRVLETVGSFTLDETNYMVISTTNSTITWTLPDPTTCAARHYVLFNRSNTGTVNIGTYTVSKGAGGNFNSLSAGQLAFIWSTGSGWSGIKITSE